MKKIIYGILILMGCVFISSNFNVDSTKLDHKTVSASGTTCKWISDTGYGPGPIYYNASIYNDDTWSQFSIMMCNLSLVSDKKDFGVVYAASTGDEKYNTTNSIVVNGDYYKFVEGVPTKSNGAVVDFYLAPLYSMKNGYSYTHSHYSSSITLPDYLLPTEYTCVCAEY